MEVHARAGTRKRTVAMAVGASLMLVLFVAGLAFANSIGAARVAENARSLHWANATLGTSSLARAALVQAITFVELEQAGLASDSELAYATDQVDASLAELAQLQEDAGDSVSAPYLTHYVAELAAAAKKLEAGDVTAARSAVVSDVETFYMDLAASLEVEQDSIQAAINENTASATKTNGYVVFILTLGIPAAAVIAYWTIARRQVREYKLKTEYELESERSVSKAKDTFIAGLSHELRTPLTSIYGFAEILTDGESEDPAQVQELSQIIANEAAEMTRMVDDLLAASRMESTGIEIEMSRTRAIDVVESAITPFERAGLKIRRPSDDAMLVTDGARLRHIVVNLLSNAARHGGDTIGVEISPGEETVDIEVWDNGPGVPEDQIESLFDRFIHNGAAPLLTGSIGLGLAVASRLAAVLDGRLIYQRFAGKTYFIMSVPLPSRSDEDPAHQESVADVIRAMSS